MEFGKHTNDAENINILLCRPEGGLNDQLCQIGKAILYAFKFNRLLIIDTGFINYSESTYRKAFIKFFESNNENIIITNRSDEIIKSDWPVHPVAANINPNNYEYIQSEPCIHVVSGEKLSFDFGLPYATKVLIHHSHGGGLSSRVAVNYLKLHKRVAETLINISKTLDGEYAAIHFRCSDYRSDINDLFNSIKQLLDAGHSKIYLATDNFDAIRLASHLFGTKIFAYQSLYSIKSGDMDVPLHLAKKLDSASSKLALYESLIDLTMMTFASVFIPIQVRGLNAQSTSITLSGFSSLSLYLRADMNARNNFWNLF
jgi:hypothetical protein